MWFWKQKEPENELESDLSIRVAEIQSRIAALRSSLERTERSNKNTPTQPKPVVGNAPAATEQDAVRAAKEAEMMALKAKLLGKKS